ncbi:MAG TPA: PilT/PilU family type 4a pilus ATPase [Vicinamibacterales bacterium]|nr:PilT/PilU family type 4a pilus ATPase [Vicinamibacterales bacterium]
MNDFDDLDRLVSELNLLSPEGSSAGDSYDRALVDQDSALLDAWLQRVRDEDGGSDLLLVAGSPPIVRAPGRLIRISSDPLSSEDIEHAVRGSVSHRLLERYRAGHAVDLAFKRPGLGRFRMNLHRERGRAAASIRALPLRIPKLADLHFSHDIGLLAALPRGLVLIGGPTGSGKTTTLAALVAAINERDERHIITVEDPIEYEHPHGRCLIEQVEIGIDAPDFPSALRSAVRQAPDVIVVGEMRDPETMRIALSAAETGHLVFATVHTTDVSAAVSRIADAFPVERQNAVRQELAMALAAILTQTLVPAKTGGVVPVAELLMVSYGARQHIRKNALQHLNQEITITRKNGSFAVEESLVRFVRNGVLERTDAQLRAAHPDEFESLMSARQDRS